MTNGVHSLKLRQQEIVTSVYKYFFFLHGILLKRTPFFILEKKHIAAVRLLPQFKGKWLP